jgi:hypothetical protein
MLELTPLIADGNSDAARRARVKLQPRDKKGRWIPTGASLFASIKSAAGKVFRINGKAIGGTATKKGERNDIRMLVGKGYESLGISPNTVLTVNPKNGELESKIKLNRDYLKSKGIDPDLQHTLPKALDKQPQTLAEMKPEKADKLDIDLASAGLTSDEDKTFRAERDQQPLAKLPPAMEDQAVTGEDVNALVDDVPDFKSGDSADSAIADALADAFYGGDVPELDQLVDKAATPTPQGEAVKLSDLQKGDIVAGPTGPLKFDRAEKRINGNWDIYVDDGSGRGPINMLTKSHPSGLSDADFQGATMKRIKKADTTAAPAAKTPAAPAKPSASKPAKPAAKPAKTPSKSPAPKKAAAPAVADKVDASRKDDGKDIVPSITPQDEMRNIKVAQLMDENGKPLWTRDNTGKRVAVEDPNALYNAILENNPQAKVKDNGEIVLERGNFTDHNGDVYKYEVALAKTHGNKYVEHYSFTDSSGNTQKFQHYDYKDSISSIYGDKNGVRTFRDQMLGISIPGKQPPTRETLTYFGKDKTLADRIRYFRGKRSEGYVPTPSDLADNKKGIKLLTPEEVVQKYLNGRPEVLNESGKAAGTKLQSFVGDAWDAIANDDSQTFEQMMVQLLGRLPDNEESRNLLINTLRDGIKQKFNGTPKGRSLATLANNIEKKIMQEGWDLRDVNKRPWTSRDGKTIVMPGNKVRYWNSTGEWSIGEVSSVNKPKQGYDDMATITFANGKKAVLRTDKLDVLGAELDPWLNEHDQDSAPTDYKPSLKGKELREARGYLNFGDEQLQQDDNASNPSGQPITTNQNAAAPYLGSSGQDNSSPATPDATPATPAAPAAPTTPANAPDPIEDMEAGDSWYGEDGEYLGSFVEAQLVPSDDGTTEAWAVIYIDSNGDEQLELVPKGEVRSPK